MDGGAWWATVHWVAQSWTRLKWLSTHARKELPEQNRGVWEKGVSKHRQGQEWLGAGAGNEHHSRPQEVMGREVCAAQGRLQSLWWSIGGHMKILPEGERSLQELWNCTSSCSESLESRSIFLTRCCYCLHPRSPSYVLPEPRAPASGRLIRWDFPFHRNHTICGLPLHLTTLQDVPTHTSITKDILSDILILLEKQ